MEHTMILFITLTYFSFKAAVRCLVSVKDCVEMAKRDIQECMRSNPKKTDFNWQRRDERRSEDGSGIQEKNRAGARKKHLKKRATWPATQRRVGQRSRGILDMGE